MRIIIYLLFLCAVPLAGVTQTTVDLPKDECERLDEKAYGLLGDFHNRQAYDTARYLLENCYNSLEYASSFMTATSAAQGISQEDTAKEKQIFADYRRWLVEVIHLNKDIIWYCNDVAAIFSTFNYYPNGRGEDYNGAISLLKYLINSSSCGGDSIYWVRWQSMRQYQLEIWRDTVQDSSVSSLDTSLVTLDELGLSGIRGQQNSVNHPTYEPRLTELIATRNPFTDILELKYRLDKSAMVRIDVYDLLGRAVYSEGQGYKAEGEHVLSLQSKSWSLGSYYVRFSCPSGEVKTVKVVKE
jgi:hypothetical protein